MEAIRRRASADLALPRRAPGWVHGHRAGLGLPLDRLLHVVGGDVAKRLLRKQDGLPRGPGHLATVAKKACAPRASW